MEVAIKAVRVNRLFINTDRDGKSLLASHLCHSTLMACASVSDRGGQHA